MTNSTPTQDQLKKEFDDRFADLWLNDDNKCVTRDVWHWITTVYEPKVREEVVNVIENLSTVYSNDRPSYGINNRIILERRWQAYRFILLGIKSSEENKQALALVEQLIDKNVKDERDSWLLDKLVIAIQSFESKTYLSTPDKDHE